MQKVFNAKNTHTDRPISKIDFTTKTVSNMTSAICHAFIPAKEDFLMKLFFMNGAEVEVSIMDVISVGESTMKIKDNGKYSILNLDAVVKVEF